VTVFQVAWIKIPASSVQEEAQKASKKGQRGKYYGVKKKEIGRIANEELRKKKGSISLEGKFHVVPGERDVSAVKEQDDSLVIRGGGKGGKGARPSR